MNTEHKTITSMEVAEMVEKDHSKLLRDIRTYASQLAEAKIGLGDFFTESTYPDANGQERPCYLVTKKGCEFISNKLTGMKGTKFTALYINKFNDMQDAIQNSLTQVPQTLVALQGMINQMIQQETQIHLATQQSQKALDVSNSIKEAIVEQFDNWRDDIRHKISLIQKGSNRTYQEVWSMLYDDIEKRAHCDLSKRISNGRFRLQNIGAPKSAVEAYGRLDVIENEPRLREIFTTIVKEYTIKYS
jgi:Rha family phage regulatory protein